jgi:hypothetical protein
LAASSRLPSEYLLELAQVAVLLDVDPRTIARWAEVGKLTPFDTMAGRRRFAQADVLRLMVDIRRVQRGSAGRPPGSPTASTAQRTRDVAVAEAALDVRLAADAVSAAAALAADAAARARDVRETAGRDADQLVADEADKNATATRARANAAAARIRQAARQAATAELTSAVPNDPAQLRRAARIAATVEAAAAEVSKETAELARSVAQAVAMTAQLVAATRVALEQAIEAEVAATATAVELRAMADAHLLAVDVKDRLRRPGNKNHP